MKILKSFKEAAKSFAFKYTSLGVPCYPYNIEPIQLSTFVSELERLKSIEGNFVEIGVARGMTTRFMCEHISSQGVTDSFTYFAIDTFDSFTSEDLEYEVSKRGKALLELRGFEYNDFEIWKRNFSQFPFVKAIQSDCSTFDYGTIAPIKLSFLDVDLYLPTRKTLPKLYAATVSGGTILVDDVRNNSVYDGAYQAYIEFCKELGVEPVIIGNKCGVIRKK